MVTDLLQKIYKNERNIDRIEIWASHRPEQAAKISVICSDERRATLKQVENIAKAMHNGNLDIGSGEQYASTCKVTSCIADIFLPKPSPDKIAMPNVILIEGEPGFGKTILTREIAFQWACDNLLCNMHLLFLVHLRDLQVPEIKSLVQLVCHVSKVTSSNKLVKSAVDNMEMNLGQNCTMVFDGYDEISEKLMKDSIIAKIIRREILPLCCLVITSRPCASTDLYRITDRRVEILGFTKDNRNEYIRKNMPQTEAEKFQEYLQNNPFVDDSCYIPLNMTVLLCNFKELTSSHDPVLPKTQTEINSQFIYKTIAHFISQKKKKTVTIKSPDDLKMPYKQHFNALCKLAFDLLGNELVVFSDADIQKYVSKKATTNWSTLGLLREANYYSVEDNEPKKAFSYLHSTIQECLAAHYIVKEAENSFLKKHFWDPQYVNAGVMYVGLTRGKSSAFKNFISAGHSGTFGKQLDISKAIMSDKIKRLHLFHCLLEAKNDKLSEQLQIDKILCNNNINLSNNTLQQKDIIHTLSFFLLKSTTKHWEKLNLSNSYMNDESLEKFSKFSNSRVNNERVSIDTIDLSHNRLSSDSVDAMISLISFFKVKNTIISDNVAEVQVFKVSLLSNIAKVGKITISSVGEGSLFLINYKLRDMDMELNFLNQLRYKRYLYAWNTDALLSISNLTTKCYTINIYEDNLPDEQIVDIVSELKMMIEERGRNITYILQSANKIIAYGVEFYQISQSFKSNSFSKGSSNWKIIDVRQCNIGEGGLTEFSQIFYDYRVEYLDTLVILECGLTASSISAILGILKCCIVKNLIISDNSIHHTALCTLILEEITVESKVLNFKMNIPMIVSINEVKILFFVNIDFNDATVNDYDYVNSQLYFSNIGLNEVNIQSFLMVCRNNKLQVNIFEINTTDEILKDVLTELEPFKNNSYVLASSTKLIAYNAKQKQIVDAVVYSTESVFTTLKLINCEISISKSHPFYKLFSNSLQKWNHIDLSGCKIKDEGCLRLCEHLTANKNQVHIEVLNLSSNSLGPDSVKMALKIFEHCIIKTLIISRNDIPIYMLNKALKEHLLADRSFLNFKDKIPLMVYESTNQPPYEICNVYAFGLPSDTEILSQTCKGNVLWNLYHVQSDDKYGFNSVSSISFTSDEINVYLLVEGVMDEKIRDMITQFCILKYGKDNKLSKVDFSRIAITKNSCKLICSSLFCDRSTLKRIKQLDFSSCHFSLACAPIIIESFQYCIIKHLVLPDREVLDTISATILKDYHAGKTIANFTEKIPLTVNIETEIEEEGKDGISYNIVANTYLQDYEITSELLNHGEDEVIKQLTTSHTYVLLDCLSKNTLNRILSILCTDLKAPYIKIFIFELTLTKEALRLITMKKDRYKDKLRYVLGSDSRIVAYNAKFFQILQAMQIKLQICDLEITHCIISNDSLKVIALNLIGKSNSLKNIKVIACKVKDSDLFEFCDILSSSPKTSPIVLKTIDFSNNLLTSSSIESFLKLLECSVIENLILSDNSINHTELTDAVYHLAGHKWSELCNVSSGIPLIIFNMPSSRHCKLSTDKMRCATIFHMNCKIDKSLLLKYRNKAKNMYFMNSLVKFGDIETNLSILCRYLTSIIKVIIYENDLSDVIVQQAAICVRRNTQLNMNYILASETKLMANSFSHQITPLLENNTLISTLQLTNCAVQFPCECSFITTLTNTCRKWESIDFLSCNIHDDGCLSLQRCMVLSKSTIKYLNFMHNKLSSASAVAIANIILNCHVKKINISSNTLQLDQVINAFICFKPNSATTLSVEIISGDSAAIIISNTYPKLLPNQLCSHKCKIKLCIMHYVQFCHVFSVLSSFHHTELSKVILYNNGLTLEGIENIINKVKLPTTSLCIQEAHTQYNSTFIDYSSESLMTNLVKITKHDDVLSQFSSITFSKLNIKYNKICVYDYKVIIDSVETTLTKLIQQQISTTLEAIKLSNCYITPNIAIKLASFINEVSHLKLFEISYSHIQESDLKVIFRALWSTTSLNFFTLRSIDCFIEDTAQEIAGIITKNSSIKYLEISNCDMKQSAVMKIARSIKELSQLKQLNLSGIALTYESLEFALKEKSTLEELNLSHCKLQNPEISIISSSLKKARFTSINLSHNNISDYAANRLSTLLLNRSISNVEISDCNLQGKGLFCILNALKHKTLIKCLNFCGNQITNFLATKLSSGISNNPLIMNLDLLNCSLQRMGTVEILTSLKTCALHLKLFKISSIVSTVEIVNLFEHVLGMCKSIESLTLQDCNCERIFNAVRKKVSTLHFLDISSSVISIDNLISIIANNTTIKHLNVSHCDVQGEPDATDNSLLGIFLEYLDLSGNIVTTVFANLIINLISANYKLRHLDIANCKIKESDLMKITNSLKLLTTLKYLNYSNIVLSTPVANILSQVIANNVYLEHLDLSLCYLTKQTFTSIASALKQVRVLKCFKLNSNHVASDETSFKTFQNLSRNLADKKLRSIVTNNLLAARKSISSPSSIKSEYGPIVVDQHKNSTKATDALKSSIHSNTEEYATVSVGAHVKDTPLYQIIPKSYVRPDANIYTPLYMTPKKRACDCSLCRNRGVTSTDKTSVHESMPPHSSTETTGYTLIPVDQCKNSTTTTYKTKFSTNSDTEENAAVSVETGKGVPLYAIVSKSNRSFPSMTSKQVTCDGSSSAYDDVISIDKPSNSYGHKGLTESDHDAVYAVPGQSTNHYSDKTIDKTKFSTHSDTADENGTVSVETGKDVPLHATISKSNRSFTSMTSKQVICDGSSSGYNDVISIDKPSISYGHKGLTESDHDTVYVVPGQLTDHSSSIYDDVISTDNTSTSYNQNDLTASNNDSVCVASELTTHDCFSTTQEVSISSNKTTILYSPQTISGIDHQSIHMAAGEMTPPVPLANHDMSPRTVNCNESKYAGDHNRMSILGDEIISLYFFDDNDELLADDYNDESLAKDKISPSCHSSNSDDYDYDIRSISSTEITLQHHDDCSSCHPTDMFEGDCDRMSIGDGEMALQDFDEMSENESTNVDVTLESSVLDHNSGYVSVPTDDYASSYVNKKIENPLTDGYVSVPNDDYTSNYVNKKIENPLTDGYVSVPNDDYTSNYVNKKFENPLTDGYVSVPNDDYTSNYVNKKFENPLTDGYVSVPNDDYTSNYVNKKFENPLTDGYVSVPNDDYTSNYVNKKFENPLTDGYVSVPNDDYTSNYVNKKFENPLTDGYVSVPNDDYTSSYVNKKFENPLTDGYGDVLSATDIIVEHNGNTSKDAYDAVSIARRQVVLQHSDKAENAATHVNDMLAANDQVANGHKHSVTNCGYETDAFTSSHVNRKHLNRNVVGEVTQNYSPSIIHSDYMNIPSFKNRTENTSTDHYDASLDRDKRTAEHSSATISESTLTNDYDDTFSRAASTISGSENTSKCEISENISKDSNTKAVGIVTQRYCSDMNSDYIIMRSRCEKSRTNSKDFYRNVDSEVNSSDVNMDYTNNPCYEKILVDTTTDGYDTLIKIDKTNTECNSTKMSSSTSANDCIEISSVTDSAISGLENCENFPVSSASVALIKITEVISCSCFLQRLEISDCRLSDPQVATVAIALSKTSTLRHLNLSYNQIVTDRTALKMASVIKSNLSLKIINLSNCHLQESGIKIIAEALVRLTAVVSIDMSKNKITYNSMKCVAAAIIGFALLEQLNFSHCFEYDGSTTSTEGVNNILLTLTRFTSLKHLDIHSNYINDDTSKVLPAVISNNNKSLSHLDLTDCKLQSTNFSVIVEKLQTTFTLKYLILSSNVITNETAHEIALAISNLSLQYLALSDCKMEEKGLLDIAESLLNVSSLKHLDLSYSSITDKVAATLASSIANNTLLVYLSLTYCLWQSNASYKRIRMVVSKLPLLKEFEL